MAKIYLDVFQAIKWSIYERMAGKFDCLPELNQAHLLSFNLVGRFNFLPSVAMASKIVINCLKFREFLGAQNLPSNRPILFLNCQFRQIHESWEVPRKTFFTFSLNILEHNRNFIHFSILYLLKAPLKMILMTKYFKLINITFLKYLHNITNLMLFANEKHYFITFKYPFIF